MLNDIFSDFAELEVSDKLKKNNHVCTKLNQSAIAAINVLLTV